MTQDYDNDNIIFIIVLAVALWNDVLRANIIFEKWSDTINRNMVYLAELYWQNYKFV